MKTAILPHGYNVEGDGLLKLTYPFSPTVKLALSGQMTRKGIPGVQSCMEIPE